MYEEESANALELPPTAVKLEALLWYIVRWLAQSPVTAASPAGLGKCPHGSWLLQRRGAVPVEAAWLCSGCP